MVKADSNQSTVVTRGNSKVGFQAAERAVREEEGQER
jgi:hypothetical protein